MPDKLSDELKQVPDEAAEPLLKRIAAGLMQHEGGEEPKDTDGLLRALSEQFPEESTASPPEPASFARCVLLAASGDERVEKSIRAEVQGPPTESYGVLTLALVTAAIVVLKTDGHVRYQNGKWDVNLNVRPLDRQTIRTIVSGLIDYLRKG